MIACIPLLNIVRAGGVKIEEEGNSLSLVFEDQEQKQLKCI